MERKINNTFPRFQSYPRKYSSLVSVEVRHPLRRVHPKVGAPQPKRVEAVVREEPETLAQDEVEGGDRQQEVGQLPELVVAEEAHAPVVRLDIRVGQGQAVAAPWRRLGGGHLEAVCVRVGGHLRGEVVLGLGHAAELGEGVPLEEDEGGQGGHGAEEGREDGVADNVGHRLGEVRATQLLQPPVDGHLPGGRAGSLVEDEAGVDGCVGAAGGGSGEEQRHLDRECPLEAQEGAKSQETAEALGVAGAEEDRGGVPAEEEGGAVGEVVIAEHLPRQLEQRQAGADETGAVDHDAGQAEGAGHVEEPVLHLQPVDRLPGHPQGGREEREEGEGALVGVAVVGNVQEVLSVPAAQPLRQESHRMVGGRDGGISSCFLLDLSFRAATIADVADAADAWCHGPGEDAGVVVRNEGVGDHGEEEDDDSGGEGCQRELGPDGVHPDGGGREEDYEDIKNKEGGKRPCKFCCCREKVSGCTGREENSRIG